MNANHLTLGGFMAACLGAWVMGTWQPMNMRHVWVRSRQMDAFGG